MCGDPGNPPVISVFIQNTVTGTLKQAHGSSEDLPQYVSWREILEDTQGQPLASKCMHTHIHIKLHTHMPTYVRIGIHS